MRQVSSKVRSRGQFRDGPRASPKSLWVRIPTIFCASTTTKQPIFSFNMIVAAEVKLASSAIVDLALHGLFDREAIERFVSRVRPVAERS